MAVWPCPEELILLPGKSNCTSWKSCIGHLVLVTTPQSSRASKGPILLVPWPLTIIPDLTNNLLQQSPKPRPG